MLIKERFPNKAVRPELHSPDQKQGDLVRLPFFPNPAFKKSARPREQNLKPNLTSTQSATVPQMPEVARIPRRKLVGPAEGKRLRDELSRDDQGIWKPSQGRDVLGTIWEAKEGRLPDLIPVKIARMSVSPFTFFRYATSLMAKDLAQLPTTGLEVQLCGDAHLRNLGAIAAPDGSLVFDLNDFDDTIRGPWEWDLKRLAASIIIAGRQAGETEKDCAAAAQEMVRRYRESLKLFSQMKTLDLARYQIHRESEDETVLKVLSQVERVTPGKAIKILTERSKEGSLRFCDRPPVLKHVPNNIKAAVFKAMEDYRETLTVGRQLLLDAYDPVDVAFKLLGTGSIGTRNYIVLLLETRMRTPLLLEFKEELQSCYAPFLYEQGFDHEGRRVALGQQRMQTVTDPFLGWATIEGRQFMVRQLSDHKRAIDPSELKGKTLLKYAVVCGKVLAKAHARTGDSAALCGYCGGADKLDKAIGKFAVAYADQITSDFAVFLKDIKAGKIKTAMV